MAVTSRLILCTFFWPAANAAAASPATPDTAPDSLGAFAAAAVYHGALIAAPSAGGLVRVEAGALVPIDLGLTPAQREISAVVVYEDEVWLGTAAGLLRVVVTSCGHRVETVLPTPVRAMRQAPGELGGLWVAGGGRTRLVQWRAAGVTDGSARAAAFGELGVEVERSLAIVEIPPAAVYSPLAVVIAP